MIIKTDDGTIEKIDNIKMYEEINGKIHEELYKILLFLKSDENKYKEGEELSDKRIIQAIQVYLYKACEGFDAGEILFHVNEVFAILDNALKASSDSSDFNIDTKLRTRTDDISNLSYKIKLRGENK